MRYASEHVGTLTSVHQWKPVTSDRFAQLLHYYSTAMANQFGHEAINTTAVILDRDATATVYYRAKEPDHPVSSPVLMTMEGPGGKTLCFETTNPDFAMDPMPAGEVISIARIAAKTRQDARLAEVVSRAAAVPGLVVVIAPTEDSLHQVRRSLTRTAVQYVLTTQIETLRGVRVDGVIFHNAGQVGQGVLGSIMGTLAFVMRGQGWMAMTGDEPMGYPIPEGSPERI